MKFTKISSGKWVSKCGIASIYAYHNQNSTSYYLNLNGVEKQFYYLNDAKKYANEI